MSAKQLIEQVAEGAIPSQVISEAHPYGKELSSLIKTNLMANKLSAGLDPLIKSLKKDAALKPEAGQLETARDRLDSVVKVIGKVIQGMRV